MGALGRNPGTHLTGLPLPGTGPGLSIFAEVRPAAWFLEEVEGCGQKTVVPPALTLTALPYGTHFGLQLTILLPWSSGCWCLCYDLEGCETLAFTKPTNAMKGEAGGSRQRAGQQGHRM